MAIDTDFPAETIDLDHRYYISPPPVNPQIYNAGKISHSIGEISHYIGDFSNVEQYRQYSWCAV